jgi:hypothetical protein
MRDGTARRGAGAMSWQTRTGIVLVVVSCVLYAALIGVPFLPVGTGAKLAIGLSLFIIGEGTFWVGCLIAGKEVMIYLRKKLWPANWRRKAHP